MSIQGGMTRHRGYSFLVGLPKRPFERPRGVFTKTTFHSCDSILTPSKESTVRKFRFQVVVAEGEIVLQPVRLRWDVTMTCNLACRHCVRGDDIVHPRGPCPPLEHVLLILEKLHPAVCSHVNLLGGEPLTCPHIRIILEDLICKNLPFTVVTNGLLLTPGLLALLQTACHSGVVVSLDGPDAESHEFLRGPGTYNPAIRAIRSLVDAFDGTSNGVAISTTLCDHTVDCIEDLIDLGTELGVGWIQFNELENHGNAAHEFAELEISAETYELITTDLFRKRNWLAASGGQPKLRFDFLDTSLRAFLRESAQVDISIPPSPCNAATTLGSISSDGRLWPCSVFHSNVKLRNTLGEFFQIVDNSLVARSVNEIWDSEAFCRFREFKSQRLHEHFGNPCRVCKYSSICTPCFIPYLLGDSFDRPDCLRRLSTIRRQSSPV